MKIKSILIAIIVGVIFAFILYKKYNSTIESVESDKLYMLQIGAYKNYESVVSISKKLRNYFVKEEDGMYKVIVAITKEENNLEKLKEFFKEYANNIYVNEEKIINKELGEYIDKYDYMVSVTNNDEVLYRLIEEVINKYKDVV